MSRAEGINSNFLNSGVHKLEPGPIIDEQINQFTPNALPSEESLMKMKAEEGNINRSSSE